MKNKLLLLGILFINALRAAAQETSEIDMADALYENGRIYVVILVVMIVLSGLFTFLILIDRKTARLQKKLEDNES